MDMLLNKLSKSFGTSGHEKDIRNVIIGEIESLNLNYEIDKMDNLIVTIGKSIDSSKNMMIVSHMDSIGIIVNYINEDGTLSIGKVGDFEIKDFVNNMVEFENGIIGRVCCKKEEPKIDNVYIDLFVNNKEEAIKKIKEGDVAVLKNSIVEIDNNIVGCNLNNKVGCYAMLKALKNIYLNKDIFENLNKEIYFVFSTQNQLGGRGARAAAYKLEPNYCVAIDSQNEDKKLKSGKGIGIHVLDKNLVVHHEIKEMLEKNCINNNVENQYVFSEKGTDGGMIHKELCGVKTGAISIISKYKNTLNELINKKDLEDLIKIIEDLVK